MKKIFFILFAAVCALAPAAVVSASDVSSNSASYAESSEESSEVSSEESSEESFEDSSEESSDHILPDIRFDVNILPDIVVDDDGQSYHLSDFLFDDDDTDSSVSGGVLNVVVPVSESVSPLASYDGYSATISTDLVNYFRGIVSKLPFGCHYVLFRSGQYSYVFAYSDTLTFNGSQFTGSQVDVITYNSQSTSFSYSHAVQSSFSLRPLNGLIYTDLVDYYPSLSDPGMMSSRQILYLCIIFCFVLTMGSFMRKGGVKFARKKYYY